MRLPSIVALAFLALAAPFPSVLREPAAAEARAPSSCGTDYYVNSRGNCVHRPMHAKKAPTAATARCRDRTYSFSQSRRGTCSRHGGVAQWF